MKILFTRRMKHFPPMQLVIFFGLIFAYITSTLAAYPYYGTKIGPLTQLHHGVSGDVYAVDSRTIFIKNFNYDGEAPAAYFYVGNTNKPSSEGGVRLRDEKGSIAPITKRYRSKDITLSLPEGKTLRDIKWFSFWCDEFAVNFGDVTIPSSLDYPKPQKIAKLNGVHGVSSDSIVIVDAQTLLIPNFSYDGEAPDAKFWVGRGAKPSPQGLRIPDENGKEQPLRRYDKKTIVLTLPGDLTVFDIGHFGVWCEAFTVDFGHIRIPDGLNIPPSLKMLGISPQSKLNCEVLYDDLAFEVRWAVAGESIVVQLVAKLEDNEYMSFGISPNKNRTEMIGADVVVAWVEKDTGKGFAQDYYLDDKSQCSGTRGSCPDTRIEDKTNSIRLLNAAMVNGYSIVTYQRSLKAADKLDLPIFVNSSQAIVWAIGPLNPRNEVSFHSKYTKSNHLIDFGRQPTWNCPMPESDQASQDKSDDEPSEEYYDARPQSSDRRKSQQQTNSREQQTQQSQKTSGSTRRPVPTPKPANKNGAWEIPPIQCFEPEDGVFYAQMGPTGGKHGYPAITGHVGWGISWYINGLLIPEIHVVRGKTYTFVVEGGNDSDVPAKYHPFYITDDSIGGYEYKTDEEKKAVNVFAGIHKSRSGKITPTGVGRLCHWTSDPESPDADEFQSFGAYQRTLTLKCDEGEPGIISWTPDASTPDTVYYQCFTHRHLGWKIHVHDSCDEDGGHASEIDEVFAEPEEDFLAEASIRHETRIRPSDNFLIKHEKDLIKHHNMAGIPPKVNFDLMKSSEIHKLITEGIKAAEALEESINNNQSPPTHMPIIYTSATEVLEGEMPPSETNTSQIRHDPLISTNLGPSVYLKPPVSSRTPFPQRANQPVRRPAPLHVEKRRPQRPVVLPQPSMIVNHYRKVIPALMKPFVKEKPFPIQPIASVLLMGQPSEIQKHEPILKSKNKQHFELESQHETKKRFSNTKSNIKAKLPFKNVSEKMEFPEKPFSFKKPFEVKEVEETDSDLATLQPAMNTGFKEERVVIESGFRPIIRRVDNPEKINRRKDDPNAEIDEAMETDTLFLSQPKEQQNQSFEPMFIPSPPDSTNSTLKPNSEKIEEKAVDSEDEDEEEAETGAAAERLDIYYLPPDNRKRPGFGKIPDGAVVTYDGKAVLDSSLVRNAPISRQQFKEQQPSRLSKTEQLIRNTPQFRPFRGEIPPPPIPDFLQANAPQLRLKGSIHKPITEYSNPLNNNSTISTRLILRKH